jgi:hypothetical protein
VAELRQDVLGRELRDDLLVEDRAIRGTDERFAVREVPVERGDADVRGRGDLLQGW